MIGKQTGDAADMVVVMVRKEDATQRELALGERGAHHVGITGIDHQRIGAVVQQPDVVVSQGR